MSENQLFGTRLSLRLDRCISPPFQTLYRIVLSSCQVFQVQQLQVFSRRDSLPSNLPFSIRIVLPIQKPTECSGQDLQLDQEQVQQGRKWDLEKSFGLFDSNL